MANEEQHDHTEEQGEICPHMDERCRGQLTFTLGALIQGYLEAHGTALDQEKGNDEARKVLTEMLSNLPSAEAIREQEAMIGNLPGGVMPEA